MLCDTCGLLICVLEQAVSDRSGPLCMLAPMPHTPAHTIRPSRMQATPPTTAFNMKRTCYFNLAFQLCACVESIRPS